MPPPHHFATLFGNGNPAQRAVCLIGTALQVVCLEIVRTGAYFAYDLFMPA